MLDHARAVPPGAVLEADVCIVGAGAAGITLARELIGRRHDVVVLESGDHEEDPSARSLSRGSIAGRPYFALETTRTRGLGGTTASWAGECRPLDAEDFAVRDWIPGSGWPFGRGHLQPFYDRARDVCRLGSAPFEEVHPAGSATEPRAIPGGRVHTTCLHYSRPGPGEPATHFGRTYQDELAGADNLRVLLAATAVDLESDGSGERVRAVRVARPDGETFGVSARVVVLAAGGVENPRLLLMTGRKGPVGRYFMEHLYVDGAALLEAPDAGRVGDLYRAGARLDGGTVRGLLAITAEARRQGRLTGFCASLEPPDAVWGLHTVREVFADVLSAMTGGQRPVSTGARIRAVGAALASRAGGVSPSRLGKVSRGGRRFAVKNVMEQAPNPESRLVLGDELDRFGCPRVELRWRLSPIDKSSAHRAHAILREELGRAGLRFTSLLGRENDPWPKRLRGARHHMGTTRMHADPRKGVVDPDSRVHGTANLYVAGSSVFPTAGTANPTFTIVALALRLADHLRGTLA